MEKTGVIPCYEGMIMVGASKETATIIKDMESLSPSFDNGVEEWNPFDAKGWVKRLMTSKSFTAGLSGKRCIGDPGNDFVAEKAFKNGRDAEGYFAIVFPSGATVSWDNMIYSVSNPGMGDATAGSPLEFDAQSNGAPTYTPA